MIATHFRIHNQPRTMKPLYFLLGLALPVTFRRRSETSPTSSSSCQTTSALAITRALAIPSCARRRWMRSRSRALPSRQFHVSPTCSPCRSALMSGRHEFKNGVTHTIERERMSLQTFTLPQMLKTVGYTSGIFGKWHLGDEEAYRPENRGFDEVYSHGGGGIGQTYPGCGDAPGDTNINPALWHNGKWEKTTGYCTDLFFAQAIKWMDAQRGAKQPFFAYIPLNAAHGPHVLPKGILPAIHRQAGGERGHGEVLRHVGEH